MDCWVKLLGMWLFSDAIYSIMLYLTAPGVDGKTKQTWKRDHWVRVVRGAIGLALIIGG
jgi:hypothetical protein